MRAVGRAWATSYTRAGIFEKFLDMKCHERLVFDDKNQMPVKRTRHNAPP